MATTQSTLEKLETNLDESIGVRQPSISRPKLSPVASAKDVGRRPLRNFGRIQIDQVIPDPSQPRSEFSDESINQLAQSIKEEGAIRADTCALVTEVMRSGSSSMVSVDGEQLKPPNSRRLTVSSTRTN